MPEGGAARLPQHIVEEARSAHPVSVVLSKWVQLKREGREFRGFCPFHNDKNNPSLTVTDQKGFAWCASCGWHGDSIAITMQLGKVTFVEAVKELLGGRIDLSSAAPAPTRQSSRIVSAAEEARQRAAKAVAIWAQRRPIKGTVAEVYLKDTRKLLGPWPDSLGFHPALFHSPSGREMSALIAALMNSSGDITAIQRIFLDPKTADKAEPRREAKRTLGIMGDAAVRLGEPRHMLGIAEGVETGLAAKRIYGLPVWVSCGAQRMKDIWIPDVINDLIIFRDAGDTGLREASAAADRHNREWRRVVIEAPPQESDDFNTALKNGVAYG